MRRDSHLFISGKAAKRPSLNHSLVLVPIAPFSPQYMGNCLCPPVCGELLAMWYCITNILLLMFMHYPPKLLLCKVV